MRNLLDKASVAQSLDGERLMGCLHYPGKRVFLAQSDYKNPDLQHFRWLWLKDDARWHNNAGRDRKIAAGQRQKRLIGNHLADFCFVDQEIVIGSRHRCGLNAGFIRRPRNTRKCAR
jgi:hypothetical protein